jgi:hypothetical protein
VSVRRIYVMRLHASVPMDERPRRAAQVGRVSVDSPSRISITTPVSSDQLRHVHIDVPSARPNAGFVAFAWTRWLWGIGAWLPFVYYAYPALWSIYHGTLKPVAPALWPAQALFFVVVFLALPAFALYAGWMAFVVVRIDADRLIVGRWFGARKRVYRASDIGQCLLFDGRSRMVTDQKSAASLRVDFLDGSWVSMSRHAPNFRKLEAWLRQSASAETSRASDTSSTRVYRLVAHAPAGTFLGLTGWAVCWMIGSLFIGTELSKALQSPRGIGGATLPSLVFLLSGLALIILGPVCAHLLLRKVRVDAPRIRLDRWLGLIRRTYYEDDIKTWRVSSAPKPGARQARDPSLVLRFADGAWVVLTARAVNFHSLHGYLLDRAASLEDARR